MEGELKIGKIIKKEIEEEEKEIEVKEKKNMLGEMEFEKKE